MSRLLMKIRENAREGIEMKLRRGSEEVEEVVSITRSSRFVVRSELLLVGARLARLVMRCALLPCLLTISQREKS